VQCLERALHQCLKRKITSKNLHNAKFSVKCATVSQMRDCTKETARMRASVGCRTRAFEKKGRFSRFCGESADRQVGESRFESLQVKNDKRKANRTQLKENLIP
jgi:hypothetical protein